MKATSILRAVFFAVAVLASGCIELQGSGARKAPVFFVASGTLLQGETLAVLERPLTRIRLGGSCTKGSGEVAVWTLVSTGSGALHDVVSNDIPRKGARLTEVLDRGPCEGEDGRTWQRYEMAVDKALAAE